MENAQFSKVSDVSAVDCEYLTFLMQQAGFTKAQVQSFSRTNDVGPSYGGGGMLVRFLLSYDEHSDAAAPTSIVLKQTRQHPSHPGDSFAFRREADCYLQGLFDDLPGRLYVPKAYAAIVQEDVEQGWIWMEDMGDAFDITWTMEKLVQHTSDAAELHAVWWQRQEELAAMPFLLQRGQAMYHGGPLTQHLDEHFAAIPRHPRAKAIEQVFTPERHRLLKKLNSLATHICHRLEMLPQTLLHQDFYPPNLGQSLDRTVLIDWGLTGMGTPGSELSTTMWQGLEMVVRDVANIQAAETMQDQLLEEYWSSLQASGVDLRFSELVEGFELTACLRPAHAVGGYFLPGLLLGRCPFGGARDLSNQDLYLPFIEFFFRSLAVAARRL